MAKPREVGWVARLPKGASVRAFRIPVTRWHFASHLNPSASSCLFSALGLFWLLADRAGFLILFGYSPPPSSLRVLIVSNNSTRCGYVQ
jgi:hypothetical protein